VKSSLLNQLNLQRDMRLYFHGSRLKGRGRRRRANRGSYDANGPSFLTREYDARPSAHPGRDRIGMCFSLLRGQLHFLSARVDRP
jgi:hypothetical protein